MTIKVRVTLVSGEWRPKMLSQDHQKATGWHQQIV